MASSALNQKSNFHARSNSLPSRPHPLVTQIDEHLCRLKSNESASSSMTRNLSALRDLFELFDNLLQLPATQKSLAHQCNDKQVNELLNGSLKLLDVCGVAKDALLQAKEDTKQLQSILRRRRGDEGGFTNEVKEYLASRKKAKNGTNLESKSTKWSLVSKLMSSKHITCQGEATETNEFEKVDSILCTLIDNKTRKSGKISSDGAQIELQKLESSIQDFEDGVECLLRLLIKTRVSVLNILSQ
ncbi:hypothetical protein V6N13_115247 [Hibiscus sabdariffa]|uniref:Uncharacterized protein n=1 Tax=Hibiscus sabdariffa TaxID=183260 RepID=A0ABR2CSX4_9ROSI